MPEVFVGEHGWYTADWLTAGWVALTYPLWSYIFPSQRRRGCCTETHHHLHLSERVMSTNPTRLFNQATHDAADLCLCQLCASFVTASARQIRERRASLSSCCCYATPENQFQLLCPLTEVEVFLTWSSHTASWVLGVSQLLVFEMKTATFSIKDTFWKYHITVSEKYDILSLCIITQAMTKTPSISLCSSFHILSAAVFLYRHWNWGSLLCFFASLQCGISSM